VGEVQAAVLGGRAELAVHSAKDLQPVEPDGLVLAAVPERGDPRDALVGAGLAELRAGHTVATGSQRRRAQLAAPVPGLQFVSLRGNIATRLERVPPGGAIVVAVAALRRLGLDPEPMEVLGTEVMLPQVGQGAIAVECRSDDEVVLALAGAADDAATRAALEAERAFLAALGGGCSLPVAAYAKVVPAPGRFGPAEVPAAAPGRFGPAQVLGSPSLLAGARLHLQALIAAPDGSRIVRGGTDGPIERPAELGQQVAAAVFAGGGEALVASFPSSPEAR
jgi:hydroxymethylbilane synthase